MDVTFYGAAGEVTGSMHLLDTGADRILLDCGMYQGRRKESTDKNRNFSLTFIGSGPDDSRYLSFISRRNIRNIEFKGRIPNEEVKRLMPAFDCLVVPSLCHENSPTVIYEAASLGLAVIASRIGGISELVRDLGGILFVPGSRTDLARKLIWASKNPLKLKEMSKKAKSRSERYSLPIYIGKLTRLL